MAVKTTDNLRDRRLVTLAGVAPDLDGLGMVLDIVTGRFARNNLFYYLEYHHCLFGPYGWQFVAETHLLAFSTIAGTKSSWLSCASGIPTFEWCPNSNFGNELDINRGFSL
ncbi:MAG: hypothetical protein ACLQVW_22250 [Limisphaerales bacterium]